MLSTQTLPADYLHAIERAAILRLPQAGYLRIAGDDRADFLQRQTTNDVRLLAPNRSLLTVLTSPTARVEDVLQLVLDEGNAIGAITLDGRASTTARALRGKIFFMDKVTVADVSANFVQIALVGPATAAVLNVIGATLSADDEMAAFSFHEETVRVLRRTGVDAPGLRLLAPASVADALYVALLAAGAGELTPQTYELLRVEAGRPGPAAELTDAYNPLEVNLDFAVSERKGCYTGQEIIARQISYDKVTKRLVGLRLAAPTEAGAQLWVEGKPAGEITSSAESPRFGPIALASVRRPHHEPETRVVVRSGAGEQPAIVTALPFADSLHSTDA